MMRKGKKSFVCSCSAKVDSVKRQRGGGLQILSKAASGSAPDVHKNTVASGEKNQIFGAILFFATNP